MNGHAISKKKELTLSHFWLWVSTIAHNFKEVNYAIIFQVPDKLITSYKYGFDTATIKSILIESSCTLHSLCSFFFTNHKTAAFLGNIQSHQSRLTPSHFLRMNSRSCSFLQTSEHCFKKQTQNDAYKLLYVN